MKILSIFVFLLCVGIVFSRSADVSVMLPLDTISNDGVLNNYDHLSWELDQLVSVGTDAVMTDCWWGIVQRGGENSYDFDAYVELTELVKSKGLNMQFVMSFHKCGGNVGDDCNIPLPDWVLEPARNADLLYKDQWGNVDEEYLSLSADNVKFVNGKTALNLYYNFMVAFSQSLSDYINDGTINEVQVGMGPAGELRYPSYPSDRWSFPGVGAFQCWDKYLLNSWVSYATAQGHAEWNSPPTDAGGYNSVPSDTEFFTVGYYSDYGVAFLTWYQDMIVQHGNDVLQQAQYAFMNFPELGFAAKIAGIHWWYDDGSHAAELTAGYYNVYGRSGYEPIEDMLRGYGSAFDFTCMELYTQDQPAYAKCDPEAVTEQIMGECDDNGTEFAGENALEFYDQYHYNMILEHSNKHNINRLTYLRLTDTLMDTNNLNTFAGFVYDMHNLN
ncbi:Beta-amylase [Aduncisulcus paluster]|uniref:Beta-amylase n=1 Tax=Aduncisulcus paluster TaxID=2918883 RepID=A0ABQ5KU70_9EUKA|nr:Beta-amylase [Aduncisulcus paluster]